VTMTRLVPTKGMTMSQQPRSAQSQIKIGTLFAEGVSVHQIWPYVLAIFLAGAASTALGITILESDKMIMAGMILTGLGIASMWLPGKGRLQLRTVLVLLAFVAGSVFTAVSLTIQPSNPMLFAGMVLSSTGIAGMWSIGKTGRLVLGVASTFVAGILLQAVGLTLAPSDLLVMMGMFLVSAAVFGMWFEGNRES